MVAYLRAVVLHMFWGGWSPPARAMASLAAAPFSATISGPPKESETERKQRGASHSFGLSARPIREFGALPAHPRSLRSRCDIGGSGHGFGRISAGLARQGRSRNVLEGRWLRPMIRYRGDRGRP